MRVRRTSVVAAACTDAGQLVDEFHRAYGERKGLGELLTCSGSSPGAPGTTVLLDVLVAPPGGERRGPGRT